MSVHVAECVLHAQGPPGLRLVLQEQDAPLTA